MGTFNYDAPEFRDFTHNISNENSADIESYFDFDHETDNVIYQIDTEEVNCNSTLDLEEFQDLEIQDPLHVTLRRTSSVGDLCTKHNRISDRTRSKTSSKNVSSTSSLQNYQLRSMSTLSLYEQPQKFISIAEAINQFHRKTPDRFHTKSHNAKAVVTAAHIMKPLTIASSPFLITKQRVRPTTVLSHEERENEEAEQMRKFKIKAHPVNPKILAGPVKLIVCEKKTTVPEPFHLTEVVKRPPTPTDVIPPFHAQPIPKYLKRIQPTIKTSLTASQTPQLLKRYQQKKQLTVTSDQAIAKDKPAKLTKTTPQPFSFEERDKDVTKKKYQVLKELVEQDKKNREFHAKPLPKSIYSQTETGNTTYRQINSSKYSSNENIAQPVFKAKTPKVLYMKPFEPKKEARPLTEVAEFRLNALCRAKERDAFEQRMKEKDEVQALFRKIKEEEKLKLELEEIMLLRKQAEHKAQPIRQYKDVTTILPKKLTVPVSPKFQLKNKNKENLSA